MYNMHFVNLTTSKRIPVKSTLANLRIAGELILDDTCPCDIGDFPES